MQVAKVRHDAEQSLPTLTKAELAELLFEQVGLNKREAKEMVETFFDEIRNAVLECLFVLTVDFEQLRRVIERFPLALLVIRQCHQVAKRNRAAHGRLEEARQHPQHSFLSPSVDGRRLHHPLQEAVEDVENLDHVAVAPPLRRWHQQRETDVSPADARGRLNVLGHVRGQASEEHRI